MRVSALGRPRLEVPPSPNTATIAPAGDYLNVDGANTQLTGPVTNSGIITATDVFGLHFSSIISGAITNEVGGRWIK